MRTACCSSRTALSSFCSRPSCVQVPSCPGHALVQTVCRADGNCQRVYTGALNELLGLLEIGERVAVAAFQIVFLTADLTELSLDRNTGGCAGVGDAAGEGDVVLEGVVRAVDHDGGVAGAQCLHSQLEAVTVIEVHGNRNGCALCGSLGHGKVGHRRQGRL